MESRCCCNSKTTPSLRFRVPIAHSSRGATLAVSRSRRFRSSASRHRRASPSIAETTASKASCPPAVATARSRCPVSRHRYALLTAISLLREQHAQPPPLSLHAPRSASSERSAPVSSRSSSIRAAARWFATRRGAAFTVDSLVLVPRSSLASVSTCSSRSTIVRDVGSSIRVIDTSEAQKASRSAANRAPTVRLSRPPACDLSIWLPCTCLVGRDRGTRWGLCEHGGLSRA